MAAASSNGGNPPAAHNSPPIATPPPVEVSSSSPRSRRPDGSSPVGGDDISNPTLLESQQQNAGAFPKVSTNFDGRGSTPPLPDKQPPLLKGSANPNSHERTATATIIHKPNTARPSFAETVARRTAKPPDMFTHTLNAIQPVKMSEGLTIIVPPAMYEDRLKLFQFALIGRLLLPQCAHPTTTPALQGELTALLNIKGDWTLMPLGKGFFSLNFLTKEDQINAARFSSWKLRIGSLHIREWKPNFDPYKESSSSAQIWVRVYHLPAEFWHPEILTGIFRAVGLVIKLDGNTAHGRVGHFARGLVEIDLTLPLHNGVRVGLPDNYFNVEFSYENIPLLCNFCHFVGHSSDRCRKAKANNGDEGEAAKAPPKGTRRATSKWTEKTPTAAAPSAAATASAATKRQSPAAPSSPSLSPRVNTSNRFGILHDHLPDEVVPETPTKATQQHNSTPSTAEMLDTILVPAEGNSPVITPLPDGILQTAVENAKEIERKRMLHSEIHRRGNSSTTDISVDRLHELASRIAKCRGEFSIPSTTVGQPKPSIFAPNSPHPKQQSIEDKLQDALQTGKSPTAYDLDPGDERNIQDMNNVSNKNWYELVEE